MSTSPVPASCPDTDWNEIWKLQQDLQESSKLHEDKSHDWSKKENAERYDANARGEYEERVKATISALGATKEMRVLDIGAGPGTLALPLAPLVAEITAVEPGAGMLGVLKAHAEREGVRNITCVQKMWEDVDIARDLAGPYDIVIASLSLTMHDIREALRKMDAACSGSVHLFWFVDMPFWERMSADLQVPLHGRPCHPGPKADCLFGVLCQMGIYPDVSMMTLGKEYRFGSREEMLAFFCKRFAVKTPEQQRIVDEYITPLARERDGGVVVSGDSVFAHMWWKKRD